MYQKVGESMILCCFVDEVKVELWRLAQQHRASIPFRELHQQRVGVPTGILRSTHSLRSQEKHFVCDHFARAQQCDKTDERRGC